ncbi:MAG: glycosyltransferase family 2 protein [Hyphomicrobiales bacterium]|nr:glycosyltransferase family 2 protein [Hyphomicrobiales bacterium]
MKPSVSVVIPAYNRKDTLVRAIRSVLKQSLPPLEIIVVDDGSTDGTREFDFCKIDPRLRVIRHPANRGGGAARNTGIDAAQGPWIAFLDSDDEWLESKLERQFEAIQQGFGDKTLVACNVLRTFEDGPAILYNPAPPGNGALSEYFLVGGGTLQTSTLLLPTDLAKRVRFDERLARHQDWDFVLRLVQAGAEVIYIDEALVSYDANDYPHKISAQKSIGPTVEWLRLSGPLIAPKLRHTFYLSRCFHQHVRERPLDAALTLTGFTFRHLPSLPTTLAYCWGFVRVRVDRVLHALAFR